MSGVWVFKSSGVIRLVENPTNNSKVLVHLSTGETIKSYSSLDRILTRLGWERYYDDPDLLQYHKRTSIDLISLPKDFSKFKSTHMYDIVVKVPDTFHVRDMFGNSSPSELVQYSLSSSSSLVIDMVSCWCTQQCFDRSVSVPFFSS